MISPQPPGKPQAMTPKKREGKRESLRDFGEHSTTHGCAYVFERNVMWFSRVVWTLITMGLFILSIVMIVSAYNNWLSKPVLTTVESTAAPINSVAFPAITICGVGTLRDTINRIYRLQVTSVLQGHGITVDEDVDVGDIYDDYGSQYLNQLYEGLNYEPVFLAELLATVNPDEFIKSQLLVENDFIGNCSSTNSDSTDKCQEGAVHDPQENVCYNPIDTQEAVSQYDAISFCEDLGAALFSLESNSHLQGLANLIMQGKMPGLEKGFWVDIRKNEKGLFDMNGVELNPSEFSMLEPTIPMTPTDLCLILKWNRQTEKFQGLNVNCEDEYSHLCMTDNKIEPYCPQSEDEVKNLLDVLLNPKSKVALNQRLRIEREEISSDFKKINLEKSFPHLFELLWYSQLPCFDSVITSDYEHEKSMMKFCSWKGQRLPCSALFDMFPTDRGMCCTFNMQKADKMFKKSKYVDSIVELQHQDKDTAYDSLSEMPSWFVNNSEPTPQAGLGNGLTILLDSHTDAIKPSSVGEDFFGFIAMVTPPNDYPLSNQKSIRIKPGHENLVALSAVHVNVSDNFQTTLSSADRNCYFPDEFLTEAYSDYSQEACFLECLVLNVKRAMDDDPDVDSCIPWFLPQMYNLTLCDPWNAASFIETMQRNEIHSCKHCLSDCSSTKYSTSVTTVPFRKCDNKNLGISKLCDIENKELPTPGIFGAQVVRQYGSSSEDLPKYAERYKNSERSYSEEPQNEIFSKLFVHLDEERPFNKYEAYEKDIALVHFYFDSPTMFVYKSQPSLTWIEFLSQVGGLLGLCIGFSFCSAFEIIYWFGFRIWFNISKSSRK